MPIHRALVEIAGILAGADCQAAAIRGARRPGFMKATPVRRGLADQRSAGGDLVDLVRALAADQQVAIRIENDAVGACQRGDRVDRPRAEAMRNFVVGVRDRIDVRAAGKQV